MATNARKSQPVKPVSKPAAAPQPAPIVRVMEPDSMEVRALKDARVKAASEENWPLVARLSDKLAEVISQQKAAPVIPQPVIPAAAQPAAARPAYLIATLTTPDGRPAGVVQVPSKDFSSGSQGYYGNLKVSLGEDRYQTQVQMVRIGSDEEPEAAGRAARVAAEKAAKSANKAK